MPRLKTRNAEFNRKVAMASTVSTWPPQHGSDAHAFRVAWLAGRLAEIITDDEEHAAFVALAARFHDIGKRELPGDLLEQPSSLSCAQVREIQTHPELGVRILRSMQSQLGAGLVGCLHGAMFHHERWDGEGYPCRLSGAQIPWVACVIAVVDVFDALLSARPYKDAWEVERAIRYIQAHGGSQFDPAIAEVFVSAASGLPHNWIALALKGRQEQLEFESLLSLP